MVSLGNSFIVFSKYVIISCHAISYFYSVKVQGTGFFCLTFFHKLELSYPIILKNENLSLSSQCLAHLH